MDDGTDKPAPLPPLKDEKKKEDDDKEKDKKNNEIRVATYVSESIDNRLILRSRSEDDFDPDTPLSIVDLGIKMHLWLSHINTWSDAEPSLLRMTQEGQITDTQAHTMRQQLELVRTLIQREHHDDWFAGEYQILSERDILVPSSKKQRPDRVMIKGTHAIIIDYKFGYQQRKSHLEQVRDYMTYIQQMGYTTEGYIVYSALQTIHSVH